MKLKHCMIHWNVDAHFIFNFFLNCIKDNSQKFYCCPPDFGILQHTSF